MDMLKTLIIKVLLFLGVVLAVFWIMLSLKTALLIHREVLEVINGGTAVSFIGMVKMELSII